MQKPQKLINLALEKKLQPVNLMNISQEKNNKTMMLNGIKCTSTTYTYIYKKKSNNINIKL